MRYSLLSAVALTTLASAQTFTACDPTKKTCKPDPALGKTITIDFTKGESSDFDIAEGTTLKYGPNGAEFTITEDGQAPTITSKWYIFFGKVEVVLRASPGQGIVSSFVMESDDLDEIDLEWLGGDQKEVETNYFGKGNTTTYDRATYVPVASPQAEFHTYTIDWKSSSTVWSVDGTPVRTLNYGDANGGKNYPQTPMQVKMGNWVGGGANSPPGTVAWAGGKTPFNQAPFTMYVKSVTVQDYSTGGNSYVYGDMTGDWQSIKTSGQVASDPNSSSSGSSSSAQGSKTASSGAQQSSSSEGSGNLGAGAVDTGKASITPSTPTSSPSTTGDSSSSSTSPSTPASGNAAARNGVAAYAAAGLGLGLVYLIL